MASDEPTEKCDNCLKVFPESKMATHFGYCRRNIKKCDKCGEMYDINFLEEHEDQFHKRAKCQYCKLQFAANDVQAHTAGCSHRPKYCEYCELNVPVSEYPAHLKACESRTKKCDRCLKPITNKQFLIHLTTCQGIVAEQRKPVEKKSSANRDWESYGIQDHMYSDDRDKNSRARQQERLVNRDGNYGAFVKKQVGRIGGNVAEKKDSYGMGNQAPTRGVNSVAKKPVVSGGGSGNRGGSTAHNVAPRGISRGGNKVPSSRNIPEPKRQEQRYGLKAPLPKYDNLKPVAIKPPTREGRNAPNIYSNNRAQKTPIFPASKQPSQPAAYIAPTRHRVREDPIPYNPQDYDFDDIPAQNYSKNGIESDADLNEQMQIWESMKSKKNKQSKIVNQLEGLENMSQSFYRVADIEKQKAIYEDLQRRNRR